MHTVLAVLTLDTFFTDKGNGVLSLRYKFIITVMDIKVPILDLYTSIWWPLTLTKIYRCSFLVKLVPQIMEVENGVAIIFVSICLYSSHPVTMHLDHEYGRRLKPYNVYLSCDS